MINKFLEELLPDEDVTILDIGATIPLEDHDHFKEALNHPKVKLISFEADKKRCEELQANASPNNIYYPYCIGDGQEREFHEIPDHKSSLLQPNTELLARFQGLRPQPCIKSTPVKTVRLDDIDIEDVDYIKLDIQGMELIALQNGCNLYPKATLIETKADFIRIYKEQPLFGDIERELRKNNYHLMRFRKMFSRQLVPCLQNNNLCHSGAIELWAKSAIFMKSLLSLKKVSDDKLYKMAFLVDTIWKFIDIPMHILYTLDLRDGTKLLDNYLDAINKR